ncbi:MAG: hypothetical protein ABIK28_09475 [Planctomycetota bacterium]
MKKNLLLCFLLILPFYGCSYFKDRLKDASEVVEVGVGFSMGLDFNIRATKIAQAGFGSYSGDWAGLREGQLACWQEERVEMGVFPLYFHELNRTSGTLVNIHHPVSVESGYETYMNDLFLTTDRGIFEVGLTANVIALGVDVAFECAEFADFLLGWCGVDFLNDDCYSRSVEDLVTQVQAWSPEERAAAVRALRRRTGENFGYTTCTSRDEQPADQIQAWRQWKRWLKDKDENAPIEAPDHE